ncbi:phage head-tail connector protein [Litorimonas sp. RW-G-Af-16]|uniref:head-tail connector protein n=1 Tax=Litorimonas sp. RW-G-Af-16 TaxID=3241168 RepID=UPI00390C8751
MRIFDINPPPTEPITLETAKTFLRVDHDYEDTLISGFIRFAREKVERETGLSLITRAQTLARNLPKGKSTYLNCYPVLEITTARVITETDTLEVSDSAFRANRKARPVPITLTSGQNWRSAFPDGQGIEIDFVAGFGPTPDDIPMPLRQAMLLLIAQAYEHRGDIDAPTPMMVDALLMPYRGMRL